MADIDLDCNFKILPLWFMCRVECVISYSWKYIISNKTR